MAGGKPEYRLAGAGVNKYRHKQQYGVSIVCADEEDHKRTYAALTAQGYACKAVRVWLKLCQNQHARQKESPRLFSGLSFFKTTGK